MPSMDVRLRNEIPNRWAWILDVVFGGILAFAFETLEINLSLAWNESILEAAKLAFVAFCLFAFFLYDVLVYHVIITRYPYRISFLSAWRYILDILMAFLLMKVLLPGLRVHPEKNLMMILVSLTLWHLCAATWHCLANWDHYKQTPPAFALVPHLVFIPLYWAVVGASYGAGGIVDVTNTVRATAMLGICAAVLGVSVYRSRQLIIKLGATDTTPAGDAVESVTGSVQLQPN